MERLVRMKCPHCGLINYQCLDGLGYRGVLLDNCENEGCGKFFIFEWEQQRELKINNIYAFGN